MSTPQRQCYEFGAFRLDAQERLLLRDGATISLTPKAFDLLLALVERHGRLVDKEELFQTVWPDTIVEESNLSSNIALIRKALGDGENGLKFIETVPKRGYRFVAEVREAPLASVDDSTPEKAQSHADATQPDVASSPWKRPHRWVWPAVFLAAGVIVSAAIWFIVDRQRARAPMLPARIVPFTSFAGAESQPAFSPDGKQIAFVWGGENDDNKDIYVKLIGTEKPLRLTTDPADDSSPTWSPDGRYIAFLRQAAEGNGFYIVPALGGAERKLAKARRRIVTPGEPVRIAWRPSGEWGGEWLAVTDSEAPAEPVGIFLLSAETNEKRRLTSPPANFSGGDWNPAFSPDGKMLAFTRSVNGISMDIYIVAVSSGESRRLTFDDANLKGLAWTPDGREIVFSSSRGGSFTTATLWKIPAVGGTPERLLGVGQSAFTLALDRQSNRLAYEQRIHDTNIYRIDVSNSTSLSNLSTRLISSTFRDDSPNYSPDGKRIVYVSDRTGSLELWVCDSDGANPLPLTNFGGPHTGTPRWSPDGQWIVFDSGIEGNQEIFIIHADGGRPRRLTSDPAFDGLPSWSRDGRWVYFTSNRSGDSQVWKVRTEGGQAVQVTRQGGGEVLESVGGRFIYYSKDWGGLRGIWRAPVEGGEETLILKLGKMGDRCYWAIAEKGIYFAVAETRSSSVVKFFSFATGRVERQVATLERGTKLGPRLAVSPDGRWLLYTRIDQSGSDIMLMENFRW